MSNSKILPLVETAIFVALALILSLISINYAQTFYVELTVIPLLILTLRRGMIWGLVAGLLYGLLALILGTVTPLSFAQGLLEYVVAPISLGLGGIFASKIDNKAFNIICVSLVGVLVKYFFHFIAGIVFWGQYAWKGWSVWLYSLVTQGISGILTSLAAIIILLLIYKAQPKIFNVKN